jgi:Bacterial HORMA domain family 1
MSDTATVSETYSVADVENVVRNLSSDLKMIAESSGTWSRSLVEQYLADVTIMAKKKYLNYVDVTLMYQGLEIKAARYTVNENSGELSSSRPGGVMWPRHSSANLRLVLGMTSKWESEPPDQSQFNISWTTTGMDVSHSGLKSSDGRNFTSNAYGLQRRDYTL